MARLLAMADLHLSGTGDKPMDRFGEIWVDHAGRMAENWDRVVEPDDWVLLPGDLSWARNMEEAVCDLQWIGERPGRKLLLRGNHDSWWTGAAKVRAAIPESCRILHHDAFRIGRWVIVGARGWLSPDDPVALDSDRKVFERELGRFDLSVRDAARFDDAEGRLAMLHYPPWLEGRDPTEVVRRMTAAGVGVCVYGHLHGDDHRLAVRGLRDGIRYHFVAADAIGFSPEVILDEVE